MTSQERDELARLSDKVETMNATLTAISVSIGVIGVNVESIHDHETRLRSLERFRYAMPSAAVLSVLAALAAVFLSIHPA